MDGIVDIIRMQLISQQNQLVKDGKIAWKTIFLLYILSNHKLVTQRIQECITDLFKNMAFYKKCISFEKKPKGIVYLKMDKMNDLFKEMMNKHALDFGSVRMKSIEEFHAKSSKTIILEPDIYFELYYGEVPAVPCKDAKSLDDIISGKSQEKDKQEGPQQNREDIEIYENARGRVYSYNKTVKQLVEYLQQRYQPIIEGTVVPKIDKKKTPNLSNLTVLRLVEITKDNVLKGEKQDFVVSKNLTNIFLEQDIHEKLESHIERFDDRFWYASRGIPRTLGILLHGIPGCGKTSFIKSLCAAQKRPAVIIDFKLIRNVSHLRSIFQGFMELKSGGVFAFDKNKTIYVFEDFDCMSDVFLDREKKEQLDKKRELLKNKALDAMVNMHVGAMGNKKNKGKSSKKHKQKEDDKKRNKGDKGKDGKDGGKNKKNEKKKAESETETETDSEDDSEAGSDIEDMKAMAKWKMQTEEEREKKYEKLRKKWDLEEGNASITLNDFLEIMDGVVEMDGRIIVMTTNCKDKIDKALLRPGRIDIDLELKPPSLSLIAEIFFYMYQDQEDDDLVRIWTKYERYLVGSKLSTAKVMNCFMFMDPEMGLRDLVQAESPEQNLQIDDDERNLMEKENRLNLVGGALERAKYRLEKMQGTHQGDPVDRSLPIQRIRDVVNWKDITMVGKVASEPNSMFPMQPCVEIWNTVNYENTWDTRTYEEIEFTCQGFKMGLTEFRMVGYNYAPYSWKLYAHVPNSEDLWQELTGDNEEKMQTKVHEMIREITPTVYHTRYKLCVWKTYRRSTCTVNDYVNLHIRFLDFRGHIVKTEVQ